ncbi:MAG: flotillin family protein [Chloroflexi bacterium]|nr:flotillin family protein [Chloroflexota bacterium]MBU1752049.1 flotillin family protein [Chloroflexota bacterium]
MGFEIGLVLVAAAVVTIFFVIFVALAYLASRYKKVGPNEVLVISGRRNARLDPETGEKERVGFRLVRGGGAVILPVVERVDALSLELMTIEVRTEEVYTREGVPVTVDGVAQVKVASDDVALATAAERFLSKSRQDIEYVAHETLAGHLRAILGTLTVEEIYKDRDAFAQQVQQVSAGDLRNMGLGIDSFVIKDIQDTQGYLDALGQARLAQVKRDAAIGQAVAARDATIKSAEARQEGESAKYIAETKIAEANKNYQVQKATYDAETNRRKAEAELAYVLQQNITNQEVKEQEVQIEVVAKSKQIQVQEQEVSRKEQELTATVQKPAEAERYRVQTLAEAAKFETLTHAEGQASAIRSVGEAEGDAIRAKGLAEAEVVQATGFAEAEAMLKKAQAWQQYNEAAILQQLIEALPQVASAIAEPLSKMDRMVVISSGGEGGAGSSKVTRDVVDIVAQVPATLEAVTGVDLMAMLKNLPGVTGKKPSEPEA